MGEPYLEKAQRTGRLIVPSKLGEIPEEAYDMELSELSLAGTERLQRLVWEREQCLVWEREQCLAPRSRLCGGMLRCHLCVWGVLG